MALCIEVTEEMKRSFRADGFATSAGPVVAEPQLAVMRAACESHPATTFQGSATDCLWVADDELYGGHAWYGEKKGLVQFFGAGKLAVGYQALITDELHEACTTAAVALLEALDGLHPAAFSVAASTVVPRSSPQTMGCICKPAKTSAFTEFHQDEAYTLSEVERQGVTASLALQATAPVKTHQATPTTMQFTGH